MRRIQKFSDFSAIYEQTTVPPTDQSRAYDGTLNQILTSILNTYISTVLYPVQDYSSKVPEDIKFVELAPVERKVERFKEITERVRKAAEDNKDSKAQEVLKAWIEANSKSIEALEAIISRYQDTPADLDYMGKVINARLNEYLKELEEQAKRVQKNESVFLDLGGEGFLFEGKKRTMDDIETQVSIVNAKLASLALSLDKIPGAAAKVTALQNEVTRISQRIGELRGKKRRDIDKEELERIETRLAEIPTEMEAITKDAAKQDTVNKDIAAILIEALELTAKADKLEQEYKKAKQEVQAQAQAQARTQAVKISKTIYYNSSKIGEKNEDVQKVQKVIMDRFGPIKKISNLSQYQEFSRFGADGKFGPRTQKMIKILQKGLGYDELTGNITPKFLERIQTEKILESYSSPRTIYRFSDFKGLFEDFDVNAAVEYASSGSSEEDSPSYSPNLPSPPRNVKNVEVVTPPDEVKEVEKESPFADLSAEEKWKWLTENYSKGKSPILYYQAKNPMKFKIRDAVPEDYKGKKILRIWFEGYYYYPKKGSSATCPRVVVCWYPEGEELGIYREYIYPKSYNTKSNSGTTVQVLGQSFLVNEGKWGKGIGKDGEDFLETKKYPYPPPSGKPVSTDLQMQTAAEEISDGAGKASDGTTEKKILSGVSRIQSPEDYSKVNSFLSKGSKKVGNVYSWYDGFVNLINGELEDDDLATVKKIADHLNSVGVKATYQTTGNRTYFQENSFKVDNSDY